MLQGAARADRRVAPPRRSPCRCTAGGAQHRDGPDAHRPAYRADPPNETCRAWVQTFPAAATDLRGLVAGSNREEARAAQHESIRTKCELVRPSLPVHVAHQISLSWLHVCPSRFTVALNSPCSSTCRAPSCWHDGGRTLRAIQQHARADRRGVRMRAPEPMGFPGALFDATLRVSCLVFLRVRDSNVLGPRRRTLRRRVRAARLPSPLGATAIAGAKAAAPTTRPIPRSPLDR